MLHGRNAFYQTINFLNYSHMVNKFKGITNEYYVNYAYTNICKILLNNDNEDMYVYV